MHRQVAQRYIIPVARCQREVFGKLFYCVTAFPKQTQPKPVVFLWTDMEVKQNASGWFNSHVKVTLSCYAFHQTPRPYVKNSYVSSMIHLNQYYSHETIKCLRLNPGDVASIKHVVKILKLGVHVNYLRKNSGQWLQKHWNFPTVSKQFSKLDVWAIWNTNRSLANIYGHGKWFWLSPLQYYRSVPKVCLRNCRNLWFSTGIMKLS